MQDIFIPRHKSKYHNDNYFIRMLQSFIKSKYKLTKQLCTMGRLTFLKKCCLFKRLLTFQVIFVSVSLSSNDYMENQDLKKTFP